MEDEYKNSEQEYKNYQESYEISIKDVVIDLSVEDKIKIDKLFRKASKICHPDIVSESQKMKQQRFLLN